MENLPVPTRAIITGATGALGQAVVAVFRRHGARIACIGRSPAAGDAALRWFVAEDLSDPVQAATAVAQATEWLGGLDALVHLVGSFEWGLVADTKRDDWRRLYAVNVETTLNMIQHCVPSMVPGGAIVAVGAASAQPAGAGMAPYAAAKSGVARLIEAVAQEAHGIRANAVLPLIIDTPQNRQAMPDADPTRWTSPAAIADAIHFLTTPAARAINGASIPVTNASGDA